MTSVDLGLYILTALALIGVLVLAILGLEPNLILNTVLTALIGVVIGKKSESVFQAARIALVARGVLGKRKR